MDYIDPYFTVQEEVVKNFDALKGIYDEWKTTDSSKTSSNLSDNLKQLLRSIEWDLEDMQETVSIVESNPSRFQLSEADVAARRQFLRETREIVIAVKNQLKQTGTKKENSPVDHIQFRVNIPKPRPSTVSSGSGMKNTQAIDTRTAKLSVFPVSTDHLTEQNELMRHQDKRLDQLGASISNLKGMSRRIGDEIGDQVALLDDFSSEMAHTESRLDAVTKRTARLLHLGTDRRQWCAIGGLSLTLLFIIVLLIIL